MHYQNKKIIATFLLILALLLAPVGAMAADSEMLVPGGHTAGVKLFSEGVIVVGFSEVQTDSGVCSPAQDAGLVRGDIITKVGETKVNSLEALTACLLSADPVPVYVSRNGKEMEFRITPANDGGVYKLGVWGRDSIAGIGTITYYDPETGVFGALGHGINDVDTLQLIPLYSGSIMKSSITGIRKGESGSPGELQGKFDVNSDAGDLYLNSDFGIFGVLNEDSLLQNRQAVPVASPSEVTTGDATILSNIAGDQVKEYSIKIVTIYSQNSQEQRNMMIEITDPELLQQTGGIVQGMSGSPILQNGKLVGAVTHVLVNDPKRGYGIFLQNMMDKAASVPAKAA